MLDQPLWLPTIFLYCVQKRCYNAKKYYGKHVIKHYNILELLCKEKFKD